jgi:hypothetical protein
MRWFQDRRELDEWRGKVLNIAVDRLNAQRLEFIERSVDDTELLSRIGQIDPELLLYFEMAFLWGLFSAAVSVCPVRVDATKETETLLRLFFLNRGNGNARANEIASTAAVSAGASSRLFDNLVKIGGGAITNPEGAAKALLAFTRLAAEGRIREQDR